MILGSYNPPTYYEKSLKELNKRYYLILDNIASLFPKNKLYPEFPGYAKPFTKEMSDLDKIQSDFVVFKTDLESDSDHMDKDIRLVNEEIAQLDKDNKMLKSKLALLTTSGDASVGMLQDTKLLYNQELSGNWLLFFILVGVLYKTSGLKALSIPPLANIIKPVIPNPIE